MCALSLILGPAGLSGPSLRSLAWAQEPPPGPPTFELPPIDVAGRRPQLPSTTPAAVSVVTADEIAAMGALTVADALRILPEVRIKGSGGPGALTTISIRGSTSSQVLILLDGVPLNRPDQAAVDLSTLPIQNVDRIEVLRGPFSAIYGSGAFGGVVNIVTRSRPASSASARVGSFGESSNVASLGGELGALTYLVQGILTGSTGFAPDTDYSNSTTMARLRWSTAPDANVTLTLNRLWHVVGTPGPLPVASQDFQSRTWGGRTLLDFAWRTGRAGGPGALLRVYMVDDDVNFVGPAFAFQSEDTSHVWGAQGQVTLALGPGNLLTVGADYQGQVIAHTDNGPLFFANAGSDLGLYVQDDWQVTPTVLLSVGVREDVFSLYGTQVNPRAGVVVLLGERLVFRAAAGRTFRPPTFDELAPGLSGNPNLRPETAWTYDAGLEYALTPALALRATGYYKDATDLITSSAPLFIPQNVGHATVTGGSLELAGRLDALWFVRANFTAQRALNTATGLDVIYVPRTMGNLEVVYTPGSGQTIGVVVSYIGDQFNDGANTQVVPGHWLTAITATWALGGGFTAQAGVQNAFDVSYQESLGFQEPPGRRYFLTVTKSL